MWGEQNKYFESSFVFGLICLYCTFCQPSSKQTKAPAILPHTNPLTLHLCLYFIMRVSQILVVTHLLCLSLVRPLVLMIDPREVGDDDRDWEGDHKDPGQGADASDDLTQASVRHHVTVSETGICKIGFTCLQEFFCILDFYR